MTPDGDQCGGYCFGHVEKKPPWGSAGHSRTSATTCNTARLSPSSSVSCPVPCPGKQRRMAQDPGLLQPPRRPLFSILTAEQPRLWETLRPPQPPPSAAGSWPVPGGGPWPTVLSSALQGPSGGQVPGISPVVGTSAMPVARHRALQMGDPHPACLHTASQLASGSQRTWVQVFVLCPRAMESTVGPAWAGVPGNSRQGASECWPSGSMLVSSCGQMLLLGLPHPHSGCPLDTRGVGEQRGGARVLGTKAAGSPAAPSGWSQRGACSGGFSVHF